MRTARSKSHKTVPAATIILTREYAGNLQVYLLKRSLRSGFMPGNFVFPGGTLDRQDLYYDLLHQHCDLAPQDIFNRFGPDLSKTQALAYCVAAIRETLEEAGIFLAYRYNSTAADFKRVCELRLAVDLAKDWFVRLVTNENWCLAISKLFRWSHWITPVGMKRRFDTRFFLADTPAGQHCRPDNRETEQGIWISPLEGLERNMTAKIPLSPPTLVTLHELSKFQTLGELHVEAASRAWGQAIQPRLITLSEGAVIVEPWDPMYNHEELNICPSNLPASVVPVGKPFSRLWLNQGIWKPVY